MADIGRMMLVELGLTLAGSKRAKGMSSLAKELAVFAEIFSYQLRRYGYARA